jgi:endogenous inhibitor of DNA gyrase (YacG/DUF329 family)
VGQVRFVNCPHCGAQVAWTRENLHRPFCSERCKMIDLGDWATGKYRVPVEEDKESPDSGIKDGES